jgi:hypothetical protein
MLKGICALRSSISNREKIYILHFESDGDSAPERLLLKSSVIKQIIFLAEIVPLTAKMKK